MRKKFLTGCENLRLVLLLGDYEIPIAKGSQGMLVTEDGSYISPDLVEAISGSIALVDEENVLLAYEVIGGALLQMEVE